MPLGMCRASCMWGVLPSESASVLSAIRQFDRSCLPPTGSVVQSGGRFIPMRFHLT
jgi:hypothetical protein